MEQKTLTCILKHMAAATHTVVRVISDDCNILEYFGTYKELDVVLTDQSFRQDIYEKAQEDKIILYPDFYPIYFMVIKDRQRFYIIGPVNCDYTVKTYGGCSIGGYFAKKHQIINKEVRLPHCEMRQFMEEGILLFNVLKDADISYMHLKEHTNSEHEIEKAVRKEINQVYFKYQENNLLHNPYDQEVREANSIREGNMEKLEQAMAESFEGEYAVLSKNPLQSMKNLAIVALTIASRAAVEGGLLPEESFSMTDGYILCIDAATSINQVVEYTYKAKRDYARRVGLIKECHQKNRIVEEAKNIIYQQMHSKIIIQEIARQLSVTPQYLSSIFKKVEGIRIAEYILNKKVGLAENMLMYSEYTIEEIAYYLGFSNQSHFGKQFKKISGYSPGQYRNNYGKNGTFGNS